MDIAATAGAALPGLLVLGVLASLGVTLATLAYLLNNLGKKTLKVFRNL